MKYETLSELKIPSIAPGGTVTFTFTYVNNIESIRTLFFNTGGVIPYIRITSISISNNVLTVTVTNSSTSTVTGTYLFLLVTVASY